MCRGIETKTLVLLQIRQLTYRDIVNYCLKIICCLVSESQTGESSARFNDPRSSRENSEVGCTHLLTLLSGENQRHRVCLGDNTRLILKDKQIGFGI